MSSPQDKGEKDPIKLANSKQIEFDLMEGGDFVLVPRKALEWILERLRVIEEELDRWRMGL